MMDESVVGCDLCGKDYRLINGHNCPFDPRDDAYYNNAVKLSGSAMISSSVNKKVKLSGDAVILKSIDINWNYNSIKNIYESNSCWKYSIFIKYNENENQFSLCLSRRAYVMVELFCKPIYYNDCLELLKKIAENEHLRSMEKD